MEGVCATEVVRMCWCRVMREAFGLIMVVREPQRLFLFFFLGIFSFFQYVFSMTMFSEQLENSGYGQPVLEFPT